MALLLGRLSCEECDRLSSLPQSGSMRLGELIAKGEAQRVLGDSDIDVSGLAYDSRQVKPGDIFFSTARDGTQEHTRLVQALNRGARALVVRRWRKCQRNEVAR